jgi:hypothetical protein
LLRKDYFGSLEKFLHSSGKSEIENQGNEDQESHSTTAQNNEYETLLRYMDQDFGQIADHFRQLSSQPLDRLALFHRFVGRITFANFCQVAQIWRQAQEPDPNRKKFCAEKLVSNLQPFWPQEFCRVICSEFNFL